MNYRPRLLEARLRRLAEHFPVVLVIGARQVGKTTLVRHVFGGRARMFVFDPVVDLFGARTDPEFFLEQHSRPLILDEVQYAPELLPGIKRRVDDNPGSGQYILTGSQNLALLKQVSESLAGRVAIVELEPMTVTEVAGHGSSSPWLDRWLQDPAAFVAGSDDRAEVGSVFRAVWRGGFPAVATLPDDQVPEFFGSYIRTYVERDIRMLGDIRDQQVFGRFLGLCAALSAQEINHSQLGREVGVTPQTADRWLALLAATFVWSEVSPFSRNAVKRISHKPKGYLIDSGLGAFLQRLSTPDTLEVSPYLGAAFETLVAGDIRRMAGALAPAPAIFHWRSHGGAEVDLVLERDGRLWPIEIKCTGAVTRRHEAGFRAFRETYPSASFGMNCIVAPVPSVRQLSPETAVVPWDSV